jgi:hypothetical protein
LGREKQIWGFLAKKRQNEVVPQRGAPITKKSGNPAGVVIFLFGVGFFRRKMLARASRAIDLHQACRKSVPAIVNQHVCFAIRRRG